MLFRIIAVYIKLGLMKRSCSYVFAAVGILGACSDGRDYELTGYLQLNKGESFSITTRTPLLDDRRYNDLCLLPFRSEDLAPAEAFAFKAEDGQPFLPSVTAVTMEGKVAPLESPIVRVLQGGEAWVCLSPTLGTVRGPYVQVHLVTPHKLRLASIRWHSYAK